MSKKIFLSVAIPAFNEEAHLNSTINILIKELSLLISSFEIIIVNDCSKDETGKIADEIAIRDPRIRVFHHKYNQGIGGGYLTAVMNARGEWFIMIPADLALEPEELKKYIDASKDSDVIVGIRSSKSDYSIFRKIVSGMNIWLIRLLFRMQERQFQYICMYRNNLFKKIKIEYYRSAFFHPEILIKAKALGYKLKEVEIEYLPRKAGKATGAKLSFVIMTLKDMFKFWLSGNWRKNDTYCKTNNIR